MKTVMVIDASFLIVGACMSVRRHVSAGAEVCMAEVPQTVLPPVPEGRTLHAINREGRMTDGFGRRDFLKGAVAGSAIAATTAPLIETAQAQTVPRPPAAASATPGYAFLNIEEAAFVEMV